MNLIQKRTKTASLVLPLILVGVAGDAPLAIAQSSGTFTTTGNMTTVRAYRDLDTKREGLNCWRYGLSLCHW